jgi:tRNA (guanine26-N2/guanine27-N2)-dimethyltransferase
MRVTEGDLEFAVPEQPEDGVGDAVFYNPTQELNRDVTVAVLRALRATAAGEVDPGFDLSLRDPSYLDATAATGVRGVRAAAEGYAATLCDRDPAAVDRCERNLAANDLDGTVVHRDANAYMHESGHDVVDVDPFGTPMPFADAGVRSARTVLAVTATDTAPLCGAHFDSGVRTYAAVPRNTEYHGEMGLRVLVGALVRTAARYDVAARPVLSHASDHYARTYLRLETGATPANAAIDDLGHVHHCPECLYREPERGLIPRPPAGCPNCGGDQVLTAGPLWLAGLCETDFVRAVRARVDESMGTAEAARTLLSTLADELDRPTHYDQHRLCKTWGRPATAMDDFLEALRAAGYAASRTHYGGTTFETDADVATVREVTGD